MRTASFGCRARRLPREKLSKLPPLSKAWNFMKEERGFKFVGKTYQVVSSDGQIELNQGEVRKHADCYSCYLLVLSFVVWFC